MSIVILKIAYMQWKIAIAALVAFALSTPVFAQEGGSRASVILERVREAKEICERQSPSFTTEVTVTSYKVAVWKTVKGKKKKVWITKKKRDEIVTARPVVLCAFKASDRSWHIINIHVPYPRPQGAFQYTLRTQGYRLEHVSGSGVTRLVFDVYQGEEKLVVYRYLHSWFPRESLAKGNGPHLSEEAQFVSYTPFYPDLFAQELLHAGVRFPHGELMEVYRELREAGVPSKTFPRELVADVIDWRTPFNLAANEQMDHDKFNGDPFATTANVYVEYALNGPDAFSWSFSSFGAAGAMQFTNHVGTYDGVRAAYPRAGIDPDFTRGTRNLRNSLKAAICLLDLELSRMPLEVRLLYKSNPAVGGVYPVIAYNAGSSRARAAYEVITKNNIDLETVDLGLPEQVFVRRKNCSKCKGRQSIVNVLPRETEMYVKKYMYILDFIEQFRAQGVLP